MLLMFLCLYMSSLEYFFFFKQKTAYEMRISDWSSDVCSSDLVLAAAGAVAHLRDVALKEDQQDRVHFGRRDRPGLLLAALREKVGINIEAAVVAVAHEVEHHVVTERLFQQTAVEAIVEHQHLLVGQQRQVVAAVDAFGRRSRRQAFQAVSLLRGLCRRRSRGDGQEDGRQQKAAPPRHPKSSTKK